MEARKVHLNENQQRYILTLPNRSVGIFGRGSGKSFGLQSVFLGKNALAMPRSTQRLGAYTYEGLMKNIIPGIIQGWEQIFNWRENVHFFVGSWAPEKWGWDKPYFQTRGDDKYLIHLYNGSVIQLASMDRSINNGANIDALALDEARLIRRKKVAEMIPAMRGNLEQFGHLSNYQSMILTTDMPQLPSEKWVLDYEDDHTQDLIDGIMMIQEDLQPLYHKLIKADGQHRANVQSKIRHLERHLNDLRMNACLFFEGSSLENIDVLGYRTLKRWKETMSEHEFAVSVLNQRQDKILNGFYSALNPEVHSYDGASNYDFFDKIDDPHRSTYVRDCRMDGDFFDSQPLYVAFDHNAAINSMVIGQARGKKEAHIINVLYVKQPEYLSELLDKFIEYYKDAKHRQIVYFYDSTSIKDNSQGQEMERDEVIRKLSSANFKVRAESLGKTKSHHSKYKIWQAVLTESDPRLPTIKYNRVNCMQFERSLLNADVRKVGDEYRKDKRSEQKDYRTKTYVVPPEDATHISEAADTLLIGWIEKVFTTQAFGDLISI